MQIGCDWVDIDNRQVAGVGVGGDFLLQDRAKRLAEHEGKNGQQADQRQSFDALTGVFGADKTVQSRQRRQPAGYGVIRSTAGVDCQPGLAILQALQGQADRLAQLLGWDLANNEEPGRVRVSAHRGLREAG